MLIMAWKKMVKEREKRRRFDCLRFFFLIDEFSSIVMPRSGAVQGVVNLDFPGTQNYESLGIFFGKKTEIIFW